MSGLKLLRVLMNILRMRSHPAWDEWIEIIKGAYEYLTHEVSSRLG